MATLRFFISTNLIAKRSLQVSATRIRIVRCFSSSLESISSKKDLKESFFSAHYDYLCQIGFSKDQAKNVAQKAPFMSTNGTQRVDAMVNWLKEIGMSKDMILSTIHKWPGILALSSDLTQEKRQWFLALGVREEKFPHIVYLSPQLMGLTIEQNLQPKIDFFKQLGFENSRIADRIVERNPTIFTLSLQALRSKIQFLESKGYTTSEIVRILGYESRILNVAVETLQVKWLFLTEMFGDNTKNKVLSAPHFLTRSSEQMQRSHQFLTEKVGYSTQRLLNHPRLILRNVDTILEPRFTFLTTTTIQTLQEDSEGEVQEGQKSKDDMSNILQKAAWIYCSNANFIQKYPAFDTFLQEYQQTPFAETR